MARIEPVGRGSLQEHFCVKNDLRNHCAIVQPRHSLLVPPLSDHSGWQIRIVFRLARLAQFRVPRLPASGHRARRCQSPKDVPVIRVITGTIDRRLETWTVTFTRQLCSRIRHIVHNIDLPSRPRQGTTHRRTQRRPPSAGQLGPRGGCGGVYYASRDGQRSFSGSP